MIEICVSFGEYIDKMTILEIKLGHAVTEDQRFHVEHELSMLRAAMKRDGGYNFKDVFRQRVELRDVNEQLWDVEDKLRLLEAKQDFGFTFVDLARSVYLLNDRRAAIKRDINRLMGSMIFEEKIFTKEG